MSSSDSEIVYVSSSSTGTSDPVIDCGFCSMKLNGLTVREREDHYDVHFASYSEHPPDQQPSQTTNTSQTHTSKALGKSRVGNGSFWHRRLATPPPRNYTQGLIPLLKKALWSSHAQGNTLRAVLCSENTIHVSYTPFDAGWGCGYRNFQMACTALVDQSLQPNYSSLLNEPRSPDIHNLQSWIEDAWNSGFDSQGAQQLKNLVGTRKWLGTTDLYVAFVYRGIPAELVDIDLNGRPRGAEIVKDWIVDYYSPKSKLNGPTNLTDVLRGASPIVVTDRMPIILQHQGHSRTIVGYEVMKGGKIKLLTFDPSTKYNNTIREMGLGLSQLPSAPTAQKRPSGSSHTSHPHLKRSRSTKEDVIYVDDEDEIIITESGSDEKTQEERIKRIFGNADETAKTLQTILKLSRLHTRNLGKKDYQILYFPMTQPLTEKQRQNLGKGTITSTVY